MSVTKRWIMPEINKDEALRISEKLNVSPLAAKVLCARGLKYEQASEFFTLSKSSFHDPFLLNDMQKAVTRINKAINNNEKISVYGDYDVDGITATYILYDYLKSLGADVNYYIPDRIDEGYGMNTAAIDTLKSQGVNLIITVDVGITAVSEVAYAAEYGIDVVITDHHTLKDDIPSAVAVINPKIPTANYPFDALAGVGVAFKLIYALSGLDDKIFEKYCDIAAIGTIADMVPLKNENRYIAAEGINKLKTTKNIGIQALMQAAGIKPDELSSTDISFGIAPRLNAAGRMSKAEQSVELLLESDKKAAYEKAHKLDECNRERQIEEQKIFSDALEIISQNHLENDSFILVAKEGWAHGIIGIVSSKLTEMFYRPSAVISINPDGSGKASGRSIKGINLFDALNNCSEHLLKFGGHDLAAGFTVKAGKEEEFRKALNEYTAPLLTEDVRTPFLEIDAILELDELNVETVRSLSVLEPYGIDNKVPLFCINDVKIKAVRYTQNGKHAFITVSKGTVTKELPAFSMAEDVKGFSEGEYISVAGNIGISTFRGEVRAQFTVRDIHSSELNKRINRNELARIFTEIKQCLYRGMNTFDNNYLITLTATKKLKMSSPKINTALKIFKELNIIDVDTGSNTYIISEGINFHSKTELSVSDTFRKYNTN